MANVKNMKMNPPTNRLRGTLPKVGIRPTIDGRFGGTRELMEGQTMGMAISVAKLITENLRHANGLPVECVIADRCIDGLMESANCADKFTKEGVGCSITVTPCWCYGSETMDMDPLIPKAIWGFNGTERPGAVYLAATLAGHNQKGLPAFGIYGRHVQDSTDSTIPDDVAAKILQFAKAANAVASMKGKTYLAIGNVSMGIAGSIVDQSFLQHFLGLKTMTIDMVELVRRCDTGIFDNEEFERALAWTRENCKEGKDTNPPERQHTRTELDEDWNKSVKMALMTRDMMVGNPKLAEIGFPEEAEGHNAIAAGFQGQRQWTDHFPNGDFLEAILTSSFDWDGIRQSYIMATENDSLNAIAMLFGHLLTNTAQLFADVRTFWSPEAVKRVTGYTLSGTAKDGIIHLINSGPAALDWTGEQTKDGNPTLKPFWEITPEEAGKCLDATQWHPGCRDSFRGGGWSTDFTTKGGMPMTMSRVNMVEGLGPVLQIAEGWSVELPDNVHKTLDERTDQTWPTTWFVPRLDGSGPFRDVYSVMYNWGANHGAAAPGHVGSELITLASMLRIPVDMHNVHEEQIFRPNAWSRFGANDPQGADYRACACYGPLYK
ncbi:MAG: L-fucose isomerase [bacterium]